MKDIIATFFSVVNVIKKKHGCCPFSGPVIFGSHIWAILVGLKYRVLEEYSDSKLTDTIL